MTIFFHPAPLFLPLISDVDTSADVTDLFPNRRCFRSICNPTFRNFLRMIAEKRIGIPKRCKLKIIRRISGFETFNEDIPVGNMNVLLSLIQRRGSSRKKGEKSSRWRAWNAPLRKEIRRTNIAGAIYHRPESSISPSWKSLFASVAYLASPGATARPRPRARLLVSRVSRRFA